MCPGTHCACVHRDFPQGLPFFFSISRMHGQASPPYVSLVIWLCGWLVLRQDLFLEKGGKPEVKSPQYFLRILGLTSLPPPVKKTIQMRGEFLSQGVTETTRANMVMASPISPQSELRRSVIRRWEEGLQRETEVRSVCRTVYPAAGNSFCHGPDSQWAEHSRLHQEGGMRDYSHSQGDPESVLWENLSNSLKPFYTY